MKARIGFKLHVTAMPGFHSLNDWCYQTMWLFSGVPDDPEDDSVMEKYGAKVFYSAKKGLVHAICTKDEEPQLDVVHRMIQIAKPWTRRQLSESNLAIGNPLVQIPRENAHLMELEWTAEKVAKLKTTVERYTSRGASGAWRVSRWQVGCFA